MGPHFAHWVEQSGAFSKKLATMKASEPSIPWYPYGTMSNFLHFADLTDPIDALFAGGKAFADIGAADGDLAFYVESLGNRCDIYDYGPTNYNGLYGAACIKQKMLSSVNIFERDLDSQFVLNGTYDLIFFLGILYHLKNPYYILEKLRQHSEYLIVSTKICRHFRSGEPDSSQVSAAYLLGPDECNNDATNYWVFTQAGLERLFSRTGWEVVGLKNVGDLSASNPQDADHDERVFALLRQRG